MSNGAKGLIYRADIDGLRAVAILPVVLYHLDVVSGGLIGVNVFFVISGYLIAGLLSADLDAGRYSIARFYVRRARRIFPALVVMLALTSIGFLAVALPEEVERYGKSLAAAALFSSNIYFYFTQDYFAAPPLALPLLHTWSLAVEEQFYIVFPLLLWVLRRRAARAERIVLAALLLGSLTWSVALVRIEPSAAFYLPQSRAWELLLGVIIAVGRVQALPGRWLNEAATLLGLAVIAGSAVLLGQSVPFPGLAAVPACLGGAVIIHAGATHKTLVARLLSVQPVRLVGLISYSWYLWHWPLISLMSYLYGVDGDAPMVRALLFVASLGLAWLSWRFVERPFRAHPEPRKTRRILTVAAGTIVVLVGIAGSLRWVSELRWNIPPEVARVLAFQHYDMTSLRPGICFIDGDATFKDLDRSTCLTVAPDKENDLLIGDSHAAHLWAGLERLDPSIHVLQATASRCLPTMTGKGSPTCRAMREFLFSEFIPAHHFHEIILNGRWTTRSIQAAIDAAVALKPYTDRVVIFGPIVEYKRGLPRTLAISMLRNDPAILDQDRTSRGESIDRKFAQRAAAAGIDYFSVYQAICPESRCVVVGADGLPIQFDYGHLTVAGSDLVARKSREALKY